MHLASGKMQSSPLESGDGTMFYWDETPFCQLFRYEEQFYYIGFLWF